jgi:hypothetical protein
MASRVSVSKYPITLDDQAPCQGWPTDPSDRCILLLSQVYEPVNALPDLTTFMPLYGTSQGGYSDCIRLTPGGRGE